VVPRLVLSLLFVLFFLVYACNLEDANKPAPAPCTSAPADTCKPPTCYPNPRPPAPPK
jgi:hypothetical protein